MADTLHFKRLQRDPNYRRRNLVSQRKCRSGWTIEMVDTAWEAQGGCCAICQETLRSKEKAHADHIGKRPSWVQRGLLCKPCNSRLGWFEKRRDAIEAYVNGEIRTWQ